MNLFNNKANHFAQEVERLNALKNRLVAEVKAYPKGTWVIKSKNNTYYQFVSANEHEVTLFRKGTENKVSFFEFTKEFRVANDAEVEQHQAFLSSQFIYPVANSYKVEHKQTYFNPKNCDFYMVTCTGVHGSKVRHASYNEAVTEAKRIARKMNHPAWVVGVVAEVNP
jgi:hypothetical protein